MLGRQAFNYGQIRGYLNVFGTLFNDIELIRYSELGSEVQRLKVPCSYAPKSKWFSAITQNLGQEERLSLQLPAVSYEMMGMNRIVQQQTYPLHRNYSTINNYASYTTFKAVPYNFNMNLYLIAKNSDDINAILEQIIPWFTPDLSLTVNVIGDTMNYRDDVFMSLVGVEKDDEYEGSIQDRRIITYTLNFTYQVKLYGDITSQGLIKKSIINMYVPFGDIDVTNTESEVVTVTSEANTSNGIVITNTITENINK